MDSWAGRTPILAERTLPFGLVILVEDQRLVGVARQPDVLADFPLELPRRPVGATQCKRSERRGRRSSSPMASSTSRVAVRATPSPYSQRRVRRGVVVGVDHKAPLALHRPPRQHRARRQLDLGFHAQPFEQVRDDQPVHGPVHGDPHGVIYRVRAHQDHRPLEPGVFDPWHGDQKPPRQKAGRVRVRSRQDNRRRARP